MLDVADIDQQHRELIAKFVRLDEAVKRQAARAEIYGIIDDIIAYTQMHFAAEEQVMKEVHYPMLETHQAKHRELVHDAQRMRKKLEQVGEQVFTEWLEHWPFARVLAHIQHADHQLEDHIFDGGAQR